MHVYTLVNLPFIQLNLYLYGYVESPIMAYDRRKERARVHLVALEASSTDSDLWPRPLWNSKLQLRLKRKMAAGWMKFIVHENCKVHSYDLIFK